MQRRRAEKDLRINDKCNSHCHTTTMDSAVVDLWCLYRTTPNSRVKCDKNRQTPIYFTFSLQKATLSPPPTLDCNKHQGYILKFSSQSLYCFSQSEWGELIFHQGSHSLYMRKRVYFPGHVCFHHYKSRNFLFIYTFF